MGKRSFAERNANIQVIQRLNYMHIKK
uniref:Uncharacterized protein n=1 Tax=Arundo donax TaxID=35708 RepID=A0A0A9HTQ7_ARUDO